MEKKRAPSFAVPGGSALMAIFAVLCLTVFAILSLSTVLADGRLTEASLEAARDYYAADCKAEETLALLRQGETPPSVSESGGVYSYETAVSDTQTLFVEARLSGGEYDILRWQLKYTADWQPDERINVWSGD